MILKIGRTPKKAEDPFVVSDKQDYSKSCWQIVERVGEVRYTYETPEPNERAKMNVMYYLDNPKVADANGECHSTTLEGYDSFYLMTDEGKTIERIR